MRITKGQRFASELRKAIMIERTLPDGLRQCVACNGIERGCSPPFVVHAGDCLVLRVMIEADKVLGRWQGERIKL